MEMILDELDSGLPDAQQLTRMVIRMLAAALLGAMVGIQRERAGKPDRRRNKSDTRCRLLRLQPSPPST